VTNRGQLERDCLSLLVISFQLSNRVNEAIVCDDRVPVGHAVNSPSTNLSDPGTLSPDLTDRTDLS
jgi:hypothetical protein